MGAPVPGAQSTFSTGTRRFVYFLISAIANLRKEGHPTLIWGDFEIVLRGLRGPNIFRERRPKWAAAKLRAAALVCCSDLERVKSTILQCGYLV